MKRLSIAIALIVALLVLATLHTLYLNRLIGNTTQMLEEAQASLMEDDWEQALSLTQSAYENFTGASFFLHVTLHHSDIDATKISFREVLAFLEGKERQPAEYAAANAKLLNQLELLVEAELPTLHNLL